MNDKKGAAFRRQSSACLASSRLLLLAAAARQLCVRAVCRCRVFSPESTSPIVVDSVQFNAVHVTILRMPPPAETDQKNAVVRPREPVR